MLASGVFLAILTSKGTVCTKAKTSVFEETYTRHTIPRAHNKNYTVHS